MHGFVLTVSTRCGFVLTVSPRCGFVLIVSPRCGFVSRQTMETLQEAGELVFLYHLTAGHTSSSYAAHTALQAGLPPDIVQRGRQVCLFVLQSVRLSVHDKVCLFVHQNVCVMFLT